MANEPHDHDHDHDAAEPGDEADPQMQAQFDELLNVGIDVAQQLLDEDGGFLPFAVALTTGGEAQVLMLEEQEDLDGEEVLEALVAELGEHRDELVGAAVVSDVFLDDDQDAIRVDIEHSDTSTEAMVVALQYTATDDGHEFGELLGTVGERRIWP